jgi:ribonuclease P protein component
MPLALRRLKRRADFLRLSRTRHRYAMPGLVLQVGRRPTETGNGSESTVRVGFTVSKKVGDAVRRNRARRRLKAAAAAVLPINARPGYDYVLIGRKGTLDRPFGDLLSDIDVALQRTGSHLNHGGEAA